MKLIQFLLLPVFFAIVTSGQQVASSGSAPGDMVYARPGQLVDVGGFRLNLYCMGSGSPAVVFDSGWGDWAPAWSKVQPQITKWTRACSYDRAGAGFSDPGPMPRNSVRIAGELHTALHNAGIAGPYILVGSAYGGDNVRTFADLYMNEVAGLVLDDADPDDLEPKAMQEEAHRGHAGIPSDLRDCRNAIAEHKPLPALGSVSGRPQQTCAQQFFFRGLPEAEWSPELNAKVLEIAQTKAVMYDADASEMEQTPADEAYLQQHRRSFGSRPIRVLTSGNHGVGHLEERPPDTPKHLKYEQETTLAQARWLTLSSNSKQIFTHNSSEYIQFDEPETLINAVREAYDQTKRPQERTVTKSAANRIRQEVPDETGYHWTGGMATSRGAKRGEVEPGKFADSVTVTGDPETDTTELERVRFVMKNGEVVKNDFAAHSNEKTTHHPDARLWLRCSPARRGASESSRSSARHGLSRLPGMPRDGGGSGRQLYYGLISTGKIVGGKPWQYFGIGCR
jgi:pimeloyl-ACP methyl ester carboxylesterase